MLLGLSHITEKSDKTKRRTESMSSTRVATLKLLGTAAEILQVKMGMHNNQEYPRDGLVAIDPSSTPTLTNP